MKCVESGCKREATKTYKAQDGLRLHLCDEHYEKWCASGVKQTKGFNKKIIVAIALMIVVVASFAVVFVAPSLTPQKPQEELDFTISGSNPQMATVHSMVYVPVKVEAGEVWNLTIEAMDFPENVWVNVLVYEGYWNKGKDHKCFSDQLSNIIDDLAVEQRFEGDVTTYTATFSYECTFFIAFPTGGCTYHTTLEKA